MNNKKIIAVIGATGAQGGGLVNAILHDKNHEFIARAITRNPDSEKARFLAAKGVEVVKADLDDIESIKKAFEGAYGAYCVTNYWEYLSPQKETSQAKNLAESAKAAGVQHVIWSSLDDTRELIPLEDERMPTLMENYKVPHFDSKGEANKYFLENGLPVTILNTVFYWDNLIYFGLGPQRGQDGKLAITFPMGDKKLPGIAAEDIGKCALGVFKAGDKYIGKEIGIAGDMPTGEEMADGLSEITGEPVRYNDIPANVYRSFGFAGADDMGNMFQFKRDFNEYYTNSRDIELARKLNPELLDYQEWLEKYGDKIKVN